MESAAPQFAPQIPTVPMQMPQQQMAQMMPHKPMQQMQPAQPQFKSVEPKKARNSFSYFWMEEYEKAKLMSDSNTCGGKDTIKRCAELWKTMTD